MLLSGVTLRAWLLAGLLWPAMGALAQPDPANRATGSLAAGSSVNPSPDPIARLIDEGTNRSQIAEIFGYLTDVIGPRLTGSPNCRRANDWTRDKLASWGLTNAHLEAWGPFGRGWSVTRFSAQVVEPQGIPLIAWPKAWSNGSEWPIVADVIYVDAKTEDDLEHFKGRLKGCIALVSSPREVPIHFDALATRLNETNLLRMANAAPASRSNPRRGEAARRSAANNPVPSNPSTNAPGRAGAVSAAPVTNPPPTRAPRPADALAKLRFAVREGAALTVSISGSGDGGALAVGEATVVPSPPSTVQTDLMARYGLRPEEPTNRPAPSSSVRPWATNAPAGPPQIVLAAEQYNRLVHMLQAGEKLKMAVDVETRFQDRDLMGYNTLAEIPGTDRADEIVMLGAHLDSLASGTGATDNAAGVAVCLEAVRLLKALNLQPRRTIRIGLWSGEEQGLLGSEAYVAQHFGYYTNQTNQASVRSPKDADQQTAGADRPTTQRTLIRLAEYKHFSAYYNLDNGAGRIRGIHLQGNEALRPIFRQWLEPLRDLGAETIAASNTGGTDHLSFDAIGLPGFQFIQDPVEYWRSYHTSIDARERAPVADLQQAAVIMAAMVYDTAMLDDTLPRKPLEETSSRRP